MVNLSRLAAEIVLWASQEFRWMTLPDHLSTGSSAMPHKKNPDIAELARGRASLAAADATAILALQTGLPLTYNRDLQEDKRLVFGSHDRLMGTAQALGALVAGSEFHPPRPNTLVLSLDLAEVLVSRGVPFRESHEIVGGLVSEVESNGLGLEDLSAEVLAAAHGSLTPADIPTIEQSLERRAVPGSGSPADVAAQALSLKSWAS
jgi:argininosuccinate lyase